MKAQILVDFIIKCIILKDKATVDEIDRQIPKPTWMLHIDGASSSQKSGLGLFLTNSEGVVAKFALWFTFDASNNQAKYEAILAGLRIAKELRIKRLKSFIDLQLVTRQVRG